MKYEYDAKLAKQICQEMGIVWNDEATVPTIAGRPLTEEDFRTIFVPEELMQMEEDDDV